MIYGQSIISKMSVVFFWQTMSFYMFTMVLDNEGHIGYDTSYADIMIDWNHDMMMTMLTILNGVIRLQRKNYK